MKRYISTEREKLATIRVNGKTVYVRFRDMGKRLNRGVYVTNNADIADALEKDPNFGKYFFLESGTIETGEDVPQQHIYDKEYPDVRRTQEANKILINEYGVSKEELNSKEDALHIAEKLNILFPNL